MWLSIVLIAALATGGPAVSVETVDGRLVAGRLKDLSSETITVESDDSDYVVPVTDVLNVTRQESVQKPSSADPVLVELVDGSKLTALKFAVERGVARLELRLGNENFSLEVPTKTLRSVRFDATEPTKPWPASEAAADLLAVRKKESVDFLEGVTGDVTEETVDFSFEGEKIPVKRSRVVGIRYFQQSADSSKSQICVVESINGWKVKSHSVQIGDGKLHVETLVGKKITIPFDQVTRLDYSGGKIAYLSDMEPESVDWTPLIDFGKAAPSLAQYYAPRKDQSREQRPISLGGKQYSKGLALYSRTAIKFRLPPEATRFKAVAGIDDAVRDGGNVRLQISADDKKLFDTPIAGADAPLEIDLDITGARRLSILVDYGDDLDAADHLDLADARIVK